MKTNKEHLNINWQLPGLRSGIDGGIDRLCGPGATRAELLLQFSVAFGAALAAGIYYPLATLDWSLLQIAIAVVLAFDIAGGITTNATSSAKRWFHRPAQSQKDHWKFIAMHLIHLSLFAVFFVADLVVWLVQSSVLLAGATCLIIYAPLYLKRPIAYSGYMVVFLLSQFWLDAPVGLEWILPLFYFKLLVSHLPPEAPFDVSR
jgi:hypothetical protein